MRGEERKRLTEKQASTPILRLAYLELLCISVVMDANAFILGRH